jgi:hypothetical protein
MASTSYILLRNHVVNHARGPVPTSALSYGPDFHLRNPGLAAYGGSTHGIAHGGCIPEFTYVGGPGSSLITDHGEAFHLEHQMAMARGDLA